MSAPEAAESSGTSRQAEPEPQRKWVALLSDAVILDDDDDDDDRDMTLELDDPPRPSRLLVRNRCAHDPRRRRDTDEAPSAYILAAAADCSARLLVQYGEGGIIHLIDADPNARTITRLPRVPSSLREKKLLDISSDRSVGLIAHPQSPAHFVVAQLLPGRRLLYYSTFKGRWYERQLAQPHGCTRDSSAEHGVVAHDGRLWWVDLAYGLFSCDPLGLGAEPLRFVPLPPGCEMGDDVAFNPRATALLKQRRCVSVSEGNLRFVDIRRLSYDVKMWTLVDPDAPSPESCWEVAYELPFAEFWQAGLPRHELPRIAFVNPDDHGVVYYFYGSKVLGFDMLNKKILAYDYEDGYGHGGDGEHTFHRPIVYKLSTPALAPMQRAFPAGTHLRLVVYEYDGIDGTNGFVEPKDDGRTIMVNTRTWGGDMPHAAWMVDYINWRGKTWMLLQSSAYGRYLAGQEGMEPGAAVIVDYNQAEQEEIMWDIWMEPGIGGEGFLVNCKYGIWHVSSERCRLEPILSTPMPPLPVLPLPDFSDVRLISLIRASDAGDFTEGYAQNTKFGGRAVRDLGIALLEFQEFLLDSEMNPESEWIHLGLSRPNIKDILCVWPGIYGRLTPLVVTDLPRSEEDMVIVVLPNASSAATALRYPTMDEPEA